MPDTKVPPEKCGQHSFGLDELRARIFVADGARSCNVELTRLLQRRWFSSDTVSDRAWIAKPPPLAPRKAYRFRILALSSISIRIQVRSDCD